MKGGAGAGLPLARGFPTNGIGLGWPRNEVPMTALLDRAMLALGADDEPAEDIAPEHLDAVLEGLR